MSPFLRWQNWDSGTVIKLLKVIQLTKISNPICLTPSKPTSLEVIFYYKQNFQNNSNSIYYLISVHFQKEMEGPSTIFVLLFISSFIKIRKQILHILTNNKIVVQEIVVPEILRSHFICHNKLWESWYNWACTRHFLNVTEIPGLDYLKGKILSRIKDCQKKISTTANFHGDF